MMKSNKYDSVFISSSTEWEMNSGKQNSELKFLGWNKNL